MSEGTVRNILKEFGEQGSGTRGEKPEALCKKERASICREFENNRCKVSTDVVNFAPLLDG